MADSTDNQAPQETDASQLVSEARQVLEEIKSFRGQAEAHLKQAETSRKTADSEALLAFNAKKFCEERATTIAGVKGTVEADANTIATNKQRSDEAVAALNAAKANVDADVKAIEGRRKDVDQSALLASGKHDVLVLDSAATGHLVRLLELPQVVDQWLKAFFDLLLKYGHVLRLTQFSEELVRMSKNLKRLRQLLKDPTGSALYAVGIPTNMALEETRDLLAACRRLQVNVPGMFVNMLTPPNDCALCSALERRELEICEQFKQGFPGRVTTIYRHGELRGLQRLSELGEAIFGPLLSKTKLEEHPIFPDALEKARSAHVA